MSDKLPAKAGAGETATLPTRALMPKALARASRREVWRNTSTTEELPKVYAPAVLSSDTRTVNTQATFMMKCLTDF
eukprot:CAMPEP_0171617808 /NCGR_PEP_ID=MMETSP0990-20121206/14341_1 /TAXON_ID=483369 /ORGANISM="non described non described, Strain CCMP2098" /LENGTH=75 /DNA_ID=CAMNT_0012182431 /DNA_START=515 /DNA_END=742 /DNA_ORIENTATION=+